MIQSRLMATLAKPAQNILNRLSRSKASATGGYGLMMLVIFLTSTVLIGTSLQMVLGSGTSAYLGSMSQDNIAAKELAQTGMETVLSDIQTKLNAGTTVDTSYTYTSTNISMPNDPANLGGGNTTLGTFSATMTAARGNTFLVNVTAVVNGSTYSFSKLITMNRYSKLLDTMTGANAAYSLRKLTSSYNGSALRIRRSSDNSEQDIGFDGNGNLDVAAIKTFLSATTPPLDSVGSAAAAFGLRKLRSAYTGYAINVRRSSDSTTQDIGFTSTGDLDTASLMAFVGSGSGYVTKWYDQSGNSNDASQGTTGYQPTIVVSGVLNTMNNRPNIVFDGVDDSLPMSTVVYDDMTIMACYNVVNSGGSPGGYAVNGARIINSDVGGVASDFTVGVDNAGGVNAFVGNPDSTNGSFAPNPGAYNDGRKHWMAFTRTKATGYYNVYSDTGSYQDGNGNTGSLTASGNIWLNWHVNGSMSEVIMYGSVVSETNRLLLERNEAWYYNMYPVYSTIAKPIDLVGSAAAAYSLRQLNSSFSYGAIQVRRSNDNATQVIGWDKLGNLDVASLLTFVGTNSGYVTTWYDQSGNGRDLFQNTTTRQPRIVNAGVLETQNGRPSLNFAVQGDYMASGNFTAFASGYHVQAIAKVTTNVGGSGNALVTKTTSNVAAPFDLYSGTHVIGNGGGWATLGFSPGFVTTTPYSVFGYDSTPTATQTAHAWVNGLLAGHDAGGSWSYGDTGQPLYIGSRQDLGTSLIGYVGEVLTYGAQLSTANRQTLEQNQLQYYSPPLPAAYVTKWYDQSGNSNDMAQTSPMLQPELVLPPYGTASPYPMVLFNGGHYLTTPAGMPISADYSKVVVFSYFKGGKDNNIISGSGGNSHAFYMHQSTTPCLYQYSACYATAGASYAAALNTSYAIAGTYTETTPARTGNVYVTNTLAGTGSTGHFNGTDATLELGGYSGGQSLLYGSISEALIFARSLSATDRTTIYNDERGYFGSQ